MDRQAYRDEILFRLGGGLLDIELDEKAIDMCINVAFREVQRYICSSTLMTIPYKSCIDLSTLPDGVKVDTVTNVFRAQSMGGVTSDGTAGTDPMLVAQWQLNSGIGMANITNYVYNYAAWNTLYQIRNEMSTDLSFYVDKIDNKLYINCSLGAPDLITIEFIPRFDDVSDIVSDYWIDILVRMAVANGKIALGRIRTKYTQTNALWVLDGEKILEEGTTELKELREHLVNNYNNIIPSD